MNNNVKIVPAIYRPLIDTYIQYVTWLHDRSYVNYYSLQLFAETYAKWTKNKRFSSKGKTKFLEYLQSITKTVKAKRHRNGKPADQVGTVLHFLKSLIPKAIKLRFNPFKLLTITKSYVKINVLVGGEKMTKEKSEQLEASALLAKNKPRDDLWWYHVNEDIDHPVVYTQHQWGKIVPGDLVYEDVGFHGITGHIAMVVGIFYDVKLDSFYIKIIEAVSPYGVSYGVLDDQRYTKRVGSIYRVPNVTDDEMSQVIGYAKTKLGQKYSLRFAAGTDEGEWYCSELVWMAYKNIGRELIDRRGDLATIKSIRDGVNMAYEITTHKRQYALTKHLNTSDLVSIGGGMVVAHELADSTKLQKVQI